MTDLETIQPEILSYLEHRLNFSVIHGASQDDDEGGIMAELKPPKEKDWLKKILDVRMAIVNARSVETEEESETAI